jgi:hypothetical protein
MAVGDVNERSPDSALHTPTDALGVLLDVEAVPVPFPVPLLAFVDAPLVLFVALFPFAALELLEIVTDVPVPVDAAKDALPLPLPLLVEPFPLVLLVPVEDEAFPVDEGAVAPFDEDEVVPVDEVEQLGGVPADPREASRLMLLEDFTEMLFAVYTSWITNTRLSLLAFNNWTIAPAVSGCLRRAVSF